MKVRVGFIGCGGIARAHAERLVKIGDVEFVAFCDIIVERAKAFAQRYGGKAYDDYREMIEKEDLDACFICIPPFSHTDQEILCAERGIHLFVEKPVALTLEKACEILRAVERAGIITQVGYVLRFIDSIRRAREVVHERGGRIALFDAWRYGGIPGGPEHWWRRKELSGGQLVEQSTHQVDLARWFVNDDVELVFASFETNLLNDLPNFDVESASVVNMRFKSKAIAVVTSTCAAQPAGRTSGFRVISRNVEVISINNRECRIIEGEKVTTLQASVDPYLEEDKHFIECVKSGKETEVPYIEGVKTLEVTLAAVMSAERGEAMRLPLMEY